jgi:hypothetical protein
LKPLKIKGNAASSGAAFFFVLLCHAAFPKAARPFEIHPASGEAGQQRGSSGYVSFPEAAFLL